MWRNWITGYSQVTKVWRTYGMYWTYLFFLKVLYDVSKWMRWGTQYLLIYVFMVFTHQDSCWCHRACTLWWYSPCVVCERRLCCLWSCLCAIKVISRLTFFFLHYFRCLQGVVLRTKCVVSWFFHYLFISASFVQTQLTSALELCHTHFCLRPSASYRLLHIWPHWKPNPEWFWWARIVSYAHFPLTSCAHS